MKRIMAILPIVFSVAAIGAAWADSPASYLYISAKDLKDRIDAVSPMIIIVCPMGGGGARNTVDYFKTQGVDAERLLILEKGIYKWPYYTGKK